jgi:hypothetical protein
VTDLPSDEDRPKADAEGQDAPSDLHALSREEILNMPLERYQLYPNGPECFVFSGNASTQVAGLADDEALSDRDFAVKTLVNQLVDQADAPKIEALSEEELTAALESCLARERAWRGGEADPTPSITKLRAEVRRWAEEQRVQFKALFDQLQIPINNLTRGLDLSSIGALGLLAPGSAIAEALRVQGRMIEDLGSVIPKMPDLSGIVDLKLPTGVVSGLASPSVIAPNPEFVSQLRTVRGIRDLEATMLQESGEQLKVLVDIAAALETLNAHQAVQTTAANDSRKLMSRTLKVAVVAAIIGALALAVAIFGIHTPSQGSAPMIQATPTFLVQPSPSVRG